MMVSPSIMMDHTETTLCRQDGSTKHGARITLPNRLILNKNKYFIVIPLIYSSEHYAEMKSTTRTNGWISYPKSKMRIMSIECEYEV
jgi:hypothetical protein